MGTITFQVVETGQITGTKTFTVPDAHIDRLVVAYQSAANTSINGSATRLQVLNYWANLLMSQTVSYVQSIETSNATTTAVATIVPITAT